MLFPLELAPYSTAEGRTDSPTVENRDFSYSLIVAAVKSNVFFALKDRKLDNVKLSSISVVFCKVSEKIT